jgi:hypothetical protein
MGDPPKPFLQKAIDSTFPLCPYCGIPGVSVRTSEDKENVWIGSALECRHRWTESDLREPIVQAEPKFNTESPSAGSDKPSSSSHSIAWGRPLVLAALAGAVTYSLGGPTWILAAGYTGSVLLLHDRYPSLLRSWWRKGAAIALGLVVVVGFAVARNILASRTTSTPSLYFGYAQTVRPIPFPAGSILHFTDLSPLIGISFLQSPASSVNNVYWPSDDHDSPVVRCELVNDFTEPVFNVLITLKVSLRQDLSGPSVTTPGGTVVSSSGPGDVHMSGPVTSTHEVHGRVERIDANGGRFIFYIWNSFTQFADVVLSDDVMLETARTPGEQHVKVRQSTYPIQLTPAKLAPTPTTPKQVDPTPPVTAEVDPPAVITATSTPSVPGTKQPLVKKNPPKEVQFSPILAPENARIKTVSIESHIPGADADKSLRNPLIDVRFDNAGVLSADEVATRFSLRVDNKEVADQVIRQDQDNLLALPEWNDLMKNASGREIEHGDGRFFSIPDGTAGAITDLMTAYFSSTDRDKRIYVTVAFKFRDRSMAKGVRGVSETCGWILGDQSALHNCGRNRSFLERYNP